MIIMCNDSIECLLDCNRKKSYRRKIYCAKTSPLPKKTICRYVMSVRGHLADTFPPTPSSSFFHCCCCFIFPFLIVPVPTGTVSHVQTRVLLYFQYFLFFVAPLFLFTFHSASPRYPARVIIYCFIPVLMQPEQIADTFFYIDVCFLFL